MLGTIGVSHKTGTVRGLIFLHGLSLFTLLLIGYVPTKGVKMYESFDHFKIQVVQTVSLLGPFTTISKDSATYSRIMTESKTILEKMADGADIIWNYYEVIGINPQDSFTDDLEDRIFEYLLRTALLPYGIELLSVAVRENGMIDLDEITFFIK